MEKFSQLASRRNILVFSKNLPFIGGLSVSYKFVDVAVVFILMDYLNESWGEDKQRIAVVVTNVQDGLSSILFVIISLISEEKTGCFNMITYCTPVSIMGLVLLWISISESAAVYPALVLLAFGRSDQRLSEKFLEYQLEQDHVGTICVEIGSFIPSFVVYIMTVYVAFDTNVTFNGLFRFATFLMLGTYALFLVGSFWYNHEELSVESDLRKIYRTFKAALGKWKTEYPISPNFYYWKDYKQAHFYSLRNNKQMLLLPRVPRLFRWLDKAAIIKEETNAEVSPERQEKNGKLCMVKEVREVKSLVPMIYLGFTIFGYSFLLASGNTFFVAQASTAISVITHIDSNDIYILVLMKEVMNNISRFIYFLILRCFIRFGVIDFVAKKKEATIIRVGLGMVCAVLCCIIAWQVEVYRLSKDNNSTLSLVPQFILLGMAEGLVEGGFMDLFNDHVAKSMMSFGDSFSELVIGIGKLLITPVAAISMSSWFKTVDYDTSHLDRYFLLLGIVNGVFLLIFSYYSFRYAYKEECPEDEKVTTDQTLEQAHQLHSMSQTGRNVHA